MSQQNRITLPISFGDDNNETPHSRGIQIANRNISENMFSGAQVMQKGGLISSHLSIQQTNNNKPLFGSSKYPTQIITLELDDAPQQKQSAPQLIVAVAPETETDTQLKSNVISQNMYTNDISSYAVQNQSCLQVLNTLTDILIHYSQSHDMDIMVNRDNNCIEGIVFMDDYYCIKYKINVWTQDTDITRFELLRTDGDAMAAAKFLADIKSQFFGGNGNDDKQMSFVCLGFDASDLDLNELFDNDMKMNMNEHMSSEELDGINKALISNEMGCIDELQYLYERLCENDMIANDMMQHKQLMNTIIDATVNNRDICVVRGCLLILEKLCGDEKISLELCRTYSLITNITQLLKQKHGLIKNYVIKLLTNNIQNGVCENDVENIKKLVLEYENEWKNSILKNNGCINENMFNQIYKKLAQISQM